ncbi:hypothetical protein CAPTEDRAFT_228231 [Capitella teleta]|uniref:BCL2/adenovirus E1B 19 kDa protein-interacting protein 3 n=1 Tax=Capitella teleta TaxID=283909 RepID=R7UUN5_CAPTE|nr:hypothetical protein CAPTEDRAFT_228231 [Capitella teleta]|eukprot:ELU07071.1 hypothetical protein CAPTEDRAFT_228231 [Capitella teleta]
MTSAQRKDNREDHLNDSWVELHFQQNQPPSTSISSSSAQIGDVSRSPLPSTAMEKLLLEAQREFSRGSSRVGSATSTAASSRGSPRSPHSPNNEPSALSLLSQVPTIDEDPAPQSQMTSVDPTQMNLIDLSSRPEAVPPREWGTTFKHPRRHRLSMRHSGGAFSLRNLPLLLFTHACSFFLGAATMLFVLRKYCKWGPHHMLAE